MSSRDEQRRAGLPPSVLVRQLEHLAEDAERVTSMVREQVRDARLPAARHLRRSSLVGAGDSRHAAVGAQLAFERVVRVPCAAIPAHPFVEYSSDALLPYEGCELVVVASASGRTPRTLAALERARERGAFVAAITGDPASPLAEGAEVALTFTLPDAEPSPGVRSYSAILTTMLVLAFELARRGGYDVATYRREFESLPEGVADTVAAAENACPRAAVVLRDAPIVAVLGGGPSYGSALHAAAKLVEAAGSPALAQDLEEWWHVERRLLPRDAPIVMFAPPGRSSARATAVARAAQALGRPVVAVTAPDEPVVTYSRAVVPVRPRLSEELCPFLHSASAARLAAEMTALLGRRIFGGDLAGFPKTLDAFLR